MNRRDFLISSALTAASVVFARSWWSTAASGSDFISRNTLPQDNSNQPLIAIPFAIAAKGEIVAPEEHHIYIPLAVTE